MTYTRKSAWNKTDMSVFSLLMVMLYIQGCSCYTDDEKQAIVDKHNDYRLGVSPSAGDMRKLAYDDTVASTAINWVATCPTGHNPNRNNYGENMAFSTVPFSGENLLSGVIGWYNEVNDYTYSTGACTPGKMCGHYTQLVDTRSLKIGCATNASPCSGNTYPYVMVCNYDPAGNFNGQKPYKAGAHCSLCPDETKYCKDQFCSSCSPDSSDCECERVCGNGGTLNDADCSCTCDNTKGYWGSLCREECTNSPACNDYLTWPDSSVCSVEYFNNACALKCQADCENAK